MKIRSCLFICALFCVLNSCKSKGEHNADHAHHIDSIDLPAPTAWVNDFEHVFSRQEKQELDSTIAAFEKETTVEIAIVTFDSSRLKQRSFDRFVNDLLNQWGVGKKKIINGILIGICVDIRQIRISNGYGIEKKLSDYETKKIIDKIMIPEFRQGKMFEGVKAGLAALMIRVR